MRCSGCAVDKFASEESQEKKVGNQGGVESEMFVPLV